ncbi:triple QxxK/R motif-containing protein isoform X1 [Dasypus novemcinctus]|uniref:triple QxxK/R motif-containing protein isoform X1 n=1 Tax=Dasypus novemcinctus TaxID=9361 RepID=UPI00265EA690|nr:triple QxxK/R motif-containing protein [Dasypus novemcinctus]
MSRHLLSCKNPETAWSRRTSNAAQPLLCRRYYQQVFWRSKMGRKDASTIKLPVDQYRKQIGKQDYKKTKPILRATKLKAEAKKAAVGIKEVGLILAAILALLLAFYAFFYLRLSTDVDPDLEPDEE